MLGPDCQALLLSFKGRGNRPSPFHGKSVPELFIYHSAVPLGLVEGPHTHNGHNSGVLPSFYVHTLLVKPVATNFFR